MFIWSKLVVGSSFLFNSFWNFVCLAIGNLSICISLLLYILRLNLRDGRTSLWSVFVLNWFCTETYYQRVWRRSHLSFCHPDSSTSISSGLVSWRRCLDRTSFLYSNSFALLISCVQIKISNWVVRQILALKSPIMIL